MAWLGRLSLWLACVALVVCGTGSAAVPGRAAVGTGADWPGNAGASDEAAYSQLSQINSGNIASLGLSWALELPGETSLEATPVAHAGVLYFTGSFAKIYAVSANTGKVLWTYDPQVWKVHPEKLNFLLFPVNRGAAYDNGRVFAAAADGRLFALEARTGKLLWSVETLEPGGRHTSTGAPRVFNGKVIIGQGGADLGVRGYVTAYDQATGKRLWRFYTVPGSPEQNAGDPALEAAAKSWSPDFWKTSGGGGTVWNGITFDPELNRIYIGTGNGGPYDPEKRSPGGGDNLYLCSIVALDADTGKYAWHYQMNPREGWDYKATAGMIATTLTIDGRARKVLLQAPTNGFFYVLDRETGKVISAEKYGKVTWASRIDLATGRPVEAPNIRYESGEVTMFPGSIGAHNWQAMAYSPRTGLVYIPYMQIGTKFMRGAPTAGAINAGGLSMSYAEPVDALDGKGALVAWDPVRQQRRWIVPHTTLWNGGVLATAGNLVFQGAGDGYLYAYDAVTGRQVWKFNAGLGIMAAPMSFSVGGKQYVSVLVGYGGSAAPTSDYMNVGWKFSQPRWLLTFVLGGKAKLMPTPRPNTAIAALDDPAITFDPKDVAAGRLLGLRCIGCHGRNFVGAGGAGPDLRESPIALDRDAFWSVLHDGALLERGMPRYPALSREQAMQIWAYIRSEARKASTTGPSK